LQIAPGLIERTREAGFHRARIARLLGVRRLGRQVLGSWRLGSGLVADNPTNRRRLLRLASLLDFQGEPFRRFA